MSIAGPIDGSPRWWYDEDGYCIACGNGFRKNHMLECWLADAREVIRAARVVDEAWGEMDEFNAVHVEVGAMADLRNALRGLAETEEGE